MQSRGFVTLMSVLLIGAVGSAITLSVLLWGLRTARTGFTYQEFVQAKALADACAEEAIQQLATSLTCSASGTLTIGEGDCDYAAAGGASCTVSATGTVGDVVRRVEVGVTIAETSMSLTSWQEVAQF